MYHVKIGKFIFQCILVIFLVAAATPAMAQSPPTATTGAATGVGSWDATLNGTVNANGASTTVFFEYGMDTGYGFTFPAVPSPVTGTIDTAVSAVISELSPNTTYHFRVVAQSAGGTSYGADMSFTTLPHPPSVMTTAATAIAGGYATLNGTVNPWGISTTVTFEYGTDTNYGTTVTADQSPVTGNNAIGVSKTISGLASSTVYHFRVVGVSASGTSYGADMTFTTGAAAPTATTNAATGIGNNTATLNGTVNANGSQTTVTFEYGIDTNYGSTISANPSPVSGTSDTAVSAVLQDILPNTTYHFRVVAVNAGGTSNGTDMTFTTLPLPPTAATNAASAVGTTTATLNGTVNANDASTTVTFEYGTDTSYGTTVTADQSPVTSSGDTAVSKAINGLTNGVTYHYRVVAVNSGGTTYGADMTFTTGTTAPTATTNAATAVGTNTATLNGTVNANNDTTTVTFQIGFSTNYVRTVEAVPGTVTGSSDTAVSVSLSSLTPSTIYHYRVVAVNAGGTTYGADMTFHTKAAPTVTTTAATAVTTTGATLNGTVNANDDSTTVTFEYGTTTSYGTTVTADQSPVSGTTTTAVSKAITSLTPNTTYHYRVVGQNANGTTYGADMTFFTSAPAAPTAVTNPASFVLSNGATLNGTVIANNASTTVTFEWGAASGAPYANTAPGVPSPFAGTSSTSVSAVITGLANNTTYYYRVKAVNTNGTAYGAERSFTTTGAPAAVTDAVSALTTTSATLNGIVNPNTTTGSVSVYFQYGLTTYYTNTVTAVQSPLTGTTNTAVSAAITGLTPNTTYHYRVVAMNSPDITYGADMTFTTLSTGPAPTAVTNAASAVGTYSATLNGTVNANNTTTTVTFEYGKTTSYGRTVTADQSPVSGSSDTAVSYVMDNLEPNTTYHYRVKAQNADNTVYGADVSFTTSGLNPTATTNAATAVTASGATLNGTVNANNDSTTVTFEYGLDTSYGTSVTADQSPVTGNNNTDVSASLSGLTNNTTYHFRVVAQNSSGTSYGADRTFFTGSSGPTATTQAATNIGTDDATLNGTVNANNNVTTVTFEYGLSTEYGRTVPADQSPVTGSIDTAVSVDIFGLFPNRTYHYRVVAQNSSGTSYGADMTFFTGFSAPTVTTQAATNIGFDSATLNGLVNAYNTSTTVTFEYGTDTGYGSTVTADQSPVTGSIDTAVSANVTGLAPGTTYHFRVVGQNAYGTSYGSDMTFTTEVSHLPTVTTTTVTKITTKNAKSGGNVTDEGSSPVTVRGVCWSTSPNPTTADRFTINGYGPGVFVSTLNKLTSSTTYYVRAYATNSYGTAYGEEYQFTTDSAEIRVTIKRPHDGDEVSGKVKIKAVARGSAGSQSIARVEFYIDDTKIAECTKVPFKTDWDTTSYSDGTYTIRAVAYGQGNESSDDTITVTVNNQKSTKPEIYTNRDRFIFSAVPNGENAYLVTSAQTLLINSSGSTLNWAISTDAGWLSASPHSGMDSHAVKVSVNPKGMDAGAYFDSLIITDSNTGEVLDTVAVDLTIYNSGATTAPFGHFATPLFGSTVRNSIPVSGWVLDDIEVTGVTIYRNPVGNEGNDLVYIGEAIMLDGARPDVEHSYPDYPLNYQSGWGYILLTNSLPNQGNGTFTLYAKATDKEGNTVTLGSKIITCDNVNSVKPFGSIDTITQVETAEGSSLDTYGWALTPQPNTIPGDGSTITVWVDGLPRGNPVYDQHKKDVAALFPGYNNSDGAGGYFNLDTTSYSYGMHTLAWSVQDDAGNMNGIGFRYLSIENSSQPGRTNPMGMSANSLDDLDHLDLRQMEPVFFKKGYRADAQPEALFPDENGIGTATIKELEHIELGFGDNITAAWGYLVSGSRLRDLPAGSTLDSKNGWFSWSPGPGYSGKYLMVFVLKDTEGRYTRTIIRVTIEPKYPK